MSRIGKKPIEIPEKVEAKINNGVLTVRGPLGELKQTLHPSVLVEFGQDGKALSVKIINVHDHKERALWGLFGSLIRNMIKGVTEGFEKKLEINGIGFRAEAKGQNLVLNVGFSHPVTFSIPSGVVCLTEKNIITIKGSDKQLVGEVAANIRKIKKPEPYKGKGIKYIDETIRRKEGKTSAKGAT